MLLGCCNHTTATVPAISPATVASFGKINLHYLPLGHRSAHCPSSHFASLSVPSGTILFMCRRMPIISSNIIYSFLPGPKAESHAEEGFLNGQLASLSLRCHPTSCNNSSRGQLATELHFSFQSVRHLNFTFTFTERRTSLSSPHTPVPRSMEPLSHRYS